MKFEKSNKRNGWRMVKLGELCERIDYGFTASADFSTQEPRFLRITDIQNGRVEWDSVPGCKISEVQTEHNRLCDGDIVFARTGATTGKSFLIKSPPKAVFASYLIRMRLKEECDPEFFSLFLQGEEYWRQIRSQARGGAQPNFNASMLSALQVKLPNLPEQRRFALRLREQMGEVERARAAVQAQMDAAEILIRAVLRESLKNAGCKTWHLPDCLAEVTEGIGERWNEFPVLGATRAGLAPAKEGVGKNPGRYKPVTSGTVFYNPMRILLGSIAMVSEDDQPGITSPDYVVMRGIEGRLHPAWFYHWFRSPAGAAFIESLTRGAVRERLLFNRLAKAEIRVPSWQTQLRVVAQLREIKTLSQSLETRLAEIELLPAALLRQAFSPN
jgi:type I restriction enzyme S subunit